MIHVGIVGLGFMGMVHYLTYQKLPGVKVVAVCDRDSKKLAGDWTSIRGNFGPPGEQMDLADVTGYQSVDDLIADPRIDLVDITLPPSLHADVAVKALAAGKHVFCEKPMALTVSDCDRMIEAADKAGRKLLIGHVLPFFPEYAWALAEITSGKHGRILNGSFTRVISDPAWLASFWEANQVGGPMLDLHVHDAHFIRIALGMPTHVTTRGSLRNELPEQWHSIFEFTDPQCFAHATCGAIAQRGRPFLHGFEIRLERATLKFEFSVQVSPDGQEMAGYSTPPTILDEHGHACRVELGNGDPMNAFYAELGHVLQVIQDGGNSELLACELARDALEICRMETESLRSRA